MCDYSLESVQSRPAKVGDRLTTRLFRLRPVGFLRPKTSMLQFAYCPAQNCPSQTRLNGYVCGRGTPALSSTRPRSFARSIRASPRAHHDALEFPDGQIVLLTLLQEGQQATVLQLPATLERAKAAQPDKAKV